MSSRQAKFIFMVPKSQIGLCRLLKSTNLHFFYPKLGQPTKNCKTAILVIQVTYLIMKEDQELIQLSKNSSPNSQRRNHRWWNYDEYFSHLKVLFRLDNIYSGRSMSHVLGLLCHTQGKYEPKYNLTTLIYPVSK